MHQSNIWKESKTPFSALVLPQEPKLKSVWSSRLAPKWPTHTDNRFPFCKEDKEPKQILPFKEVPFEWSHRTEFCPQTQTLQHIRFFPAANGGHFSERSGSLLAGNSILYCCVSCKKWRIQGGGAPPPLPPSPLFLDQTEATPGHVDFQLFINIIYLFIYLSKLIFSLLKYCIWII